jgi:hypothetical protein
MKRAVLLFALLLCPSVALADLPRPPNYVEQCTVEKQCAKNEEGTSCSANHSERDKCSKTLSAQGWTFKCRTRGASVWTEIWCRPRKPDDLPAPAPQSAPAPQPAPGR